MNLWEGLREKLKELAALGQTEISRFWSDRSAAALYERFFKSDVKIDKRTGATLFVAGFIGIGLLLSIILDQNLNVAIEERDAKSELLASLQKARAAQAGEPLGTEAEHGDPFIAAASETQAAAEIDSLLRRIVLEANGTVLSSQSEPKQEEDKGPLRKIEASITIEGKIEAIQAVLFSIETGSPFIFVDLLALSPKNMSSGLGDAGPASDQTPLLRASLTTSAYWRTP
jgi:general secretion pathway protein M